MLVLNSTELCFRRSRSLINKKGGGGSNMWFVLAESGACGLKKAVNKFKYPILVLSLHNFLAQGTLKID